MASTADLCKIITDLCGDPEALSDKLTKTLTDEIIRLLATGSALELDATDISYGQDSNVDAALDTLMAKAPTAAEVLAAIQAMTDEQVSAVKTKLSIQ